MMTAFFAVGLALALLTAWVIWDGNAITRAGRLEALGQHRKAVKLCMRHFVAVPPCTMDDDGARKLWVKMTERNLRLAQLARLSAAGLPEPNREIVAKLDAILEETQTMQRAFQGGAVDPELSPVTQDWYQRCARVITLSAAVEKEI